MHHLSLSDLSGHSVVVEWEGGELKATPTQVVTNHCLSEVNNSESITESLRRFNMLNEEHLPVTDKQQAQQAIQAASYPSGTLWTVIYDQQTLTATHFFSCEWEQPLTNTLSDN
jgi:penicillin V acylase-like amidase (Ntn superfamily)